MNTKILQKCIEKLKQKEPEISYVLGMLETLVEMQDTNTFKVERKEDAGRFNVATAIPVVQEEREVSEAEMLEKLAAARVKEVEAMSTIDVITEK